MENVLSSAKNWIRHPMIVLFFIITILMLPNAINLNSISFRGAIVVGIGADLIDDQIELSVAINISSTTESLSENTKIITTKGQTIADAMANASILIGRTMRLWHTRFVVIGENLAKDEVSLLMDSAIRTNKMRNTVQLIFTNSSIKDLFNVGIQLKSQTGLNLSDLICHKNSTSTTKISSNIDSFYKGLFSESEISKINAVNMTSDITKGINPASDVSGGLSSSGGSAGSSTSESSSQSSSSGGADPTDSSSSEGGTNSSGSSVQNSFISNDEGIAVFKKGKFVRLLSKDEAMGLNWINNEYVPKKLMVETNNHGDLSNSIINFEILKKDVKIETFFKDDKPFYSIKVYMHVDLDEIVSNLKGDVTANHETIDKYVKSSVGRKIRQDLSQSFNIAKQEKIDIFEFNTKFYQNNKKEYEKYIKNGNSKDDLIEDTQVACDVEIKII